eukprot:284449_1
MTHRSRDRDYNDRYKDRDERRHDKHRRTSSRRSPERKLEGGEYRDGSRSRHHRSSNSERRRRKDSSRERVRHRSRSRCRSRENHERNHRGSHRSSSSRHNSMYRSNRRRTRKKESDYESSSDDSSSTNSSSSGGYKSKPKAILSADSLASLMQPLSNAGGIPSVPATTLSSAVTASKLAAAAAAAPAPTPTIPPLVFTKSESVLSPPLNGAAASKVDKSDLELFVGNTPPQGNASEVVLRTFLNAAMHQVGLAMAPGDAVVSVRISNKYSFMRLRTVEEATKALSLNGIPFAGTMLNVRRPSSYKGTETEAPTWQMVTGAITGHGGGAVVDVAPKTHREIHVGGVSPEMHALAIETFLSEAMKQVGLVPADSQASPILGVRSSGTYAFVECRTAEIANFLLNLDGITFHSKQLRFNRPAKYTGPLDLKRKTWEETLKDYQSRVSATKVLQLSNMLSEEDMADEDGLADVEEDTRQECEKLAPVVSVTVPRRLSDSVQDRAGSSYVFVEFETEEGARKAQISLQSRLFDGRRVIADFFDEKKYKDGIYGEQSDWNDGEEGKNGGTAGCDEATEGAAAPRESTPKAAEDSNSPNLDCGRGDDDTNLKVTQATVEICTNSLVGTGSDDAAAEDFNSKSEMHQESMGDE